MRIFFVLFFLFTIAFGADTIQVTSKNTLIRTYLAKIQGQIYDNFSPPFDTQGQQARVSIRLDADGDVLDFKIISYSRSNLFNGEVDRLKKRIVLQKFPQNPNGVSGSYMMLLVAKE